MVLRLIRRKPDEADETAMPKAVSGWPVRPIDDLAPLIGRCRGGERDALRTLIVTVGPLMLQMVRRVMGPRDPDVEDVFQEATLGLVRALSGFRAECSTRHFACRIASLTALKARRDRARDRAGQDGSVAFTSGAGHEGGTDESEPAERDDTSAPAPWTAVRGDTPIGGALPGNPDWALMTRRREILLALLDLLPPPQAEALVLHYVAGLTVEEVAASAGVAAETTRSRLRLAKAALRQRIALDPVATELLMEGPR